MFQLTDGRPWWKQVISGVLLAPLILFYLLFGIVVITFVAFLPEFIAANGESLLVTVGIIASVGLYAAAMVWAREL